MKKLLVVMLVNASTSLQAQGVNEVPVPNPEFVCVTTAGAGLIRIEFDEAAGIDTLQYFSTGINGSYIVETIWIKDQGSATLDQVFGVPATPSALDHRMGYQLILRNTHGKTAYVWQPCILYTP
jgi:hypothetical protein